jgi:hypothetical protein
VLEATGRGKRSLIVIAGADAPAEPGPGSGPHVLEDREISGTRRLIADSYVPAGARTFEVEHTLGLAVGDTIAIHRPSTAKWIAAIGMDRIPPRKDGGRTVQWREGTKDIFFNRVITDIAGRRITVDAPLFHWLDREYEQAAVFKHEASGLIEEAGVENLRSVSAFRHPTDEEHAWIMVELDQVRNAKVRNVTAVHFAGGAVRTGYETKWITVQDSEALDLISELDGGRRYPFSMRGQLHLVQRCHAREGRHDFVTGTHRSGGIVFLDCLSE